LRGISPQITSLAVEGSPLQSHSSRRR
jgi:hypothetical protein